MRYLSMLEAVEAVNNEEVVVFPTETFYGVGGLALSGRAVSGVFRAKQRAAGQPLLVIVGHEDQLFLLVKQVPEHLVALLRAMWPGPLSVIFSAKEQVPAALTAGTNKVAVRLTSHPVARELCLSCGPLTASSANLAGEPPTTQAKLISEQLAGACRGVLDLPPSPKGGRPSTLVEVIGQNTLRIVRLGAISAVELTQLGWQVEPSGNE